MIEHTAMASLLPMWLPLATWLLACTGCVLAGLLVHGMLHLAARAWPALLGRRAVWLAAQVVIVGAALLPFLPRLQHAGVAPAFTLALDAQPVATAPPVSAATMAVPASALAGSSSVMAAPSSALAGPAAALAVPAATLAVPAATLAVPAAALTVPAAALADAQPTPVTAAPGAGVAATPAALAATALGAAGIAPAPAALPAGAAGPLSPLSPSALWSPSAPASQTALPLSLAATLPALWAALYFAGLAHAVHRLLRARRLWRGLLATASRLTPQQLADHGAFDARQLDAIARQRLVVMETGAAVSPMLLGAWRPVLLLPQHLRSFSAEQQQMIVAHELHHWRARDPLWLGWSAAVRTLLWFNPATRWLHDKTAWAVELACDQRVLAGRPQQQRKQYAAALLGQWKMQLTMAPAMGTHA
ncbi:MAG: M56 family metallopeptidase, partial [Duganella sp.]